jgi:hypothetical protein
MKNPAFAASHVAPLALRGIPFAALRLCSHIRSVVLCALVTFGLAACASDQGVGSSAAAAASSGSLVAPNVGVIDRTVAVTQGATPAATTTTSTPATAVASVPQPVPVTPAPISTGSATLDWTPPTTNSDGSALTNLAGYTVYYGTSPDSLTQSVKVSNPGLTAYTLSNLTSGTWYFAVTSYSSTGVESTRSGVISTKI